MILKKTLSREILKGNIPKHWKKYRDNRQLLYHTMRTEGFYFLFGEFWHWGLGDHLSGMAAKYWVKFPIDPGTEKLNFQIEKTS